MRKFITGTPSKAYMKHKSLPKPKICMKVSKIPIWEKHSTEDISSKEIGYTSKPLLNTQVKMKIQGQDIYIWEMKIYNLPNSPAMEHQPQKYNVCLKSL